MAVGNLTEFTGNGGILAAMSVACFGWHVQQAFMALRFLEN